MERQRLDVEVLHVLEESDCDDGMADFNEAILQLGDMTADGSQKLVPADLLVSNSLSLMLSEEMEMEPCHLGSLLLLDEELADSPASSEEDSTEVPPAPQSQSSVDLRPSSDGNFASRSGDNSGLYLQLTQVTTVQYLL